MRRAEPALACHRPSEVCVELDIQPYVLKFWESEFPELGRRIGAKRLYGPTELAMVRQIKRCLEEESLSLDETRGALERAYPAADAAAAAAPTSPRDDGHRRSDEIERRLALALDQLEQAQRERAAAEARVAELGAALAQAQSGQAEAPTSWRDELEAERQRVVALQVELQRSWDDAAPLREEVARRRAEWSDLQQCAAAEKAELAAQIATLERTLAGLSEAAAEAEQFRRRAAALETELRAAEQDRVRLADELAAAARQVEEGARCAAELPRAVAQAAELETQLAEVARERDRLRRLAAAEVAAALQEVRGVSVAVDKLMMTLSAASIRPERPASPDAAPAPDRPIAAEAPEP